MRHRFVIAILLIAGISFTQSRWHLGPWTDSVSGGTGAPTIEDAWRMQTSGVIVTAGGNVERVLSEDATGGRHQRFILKLPSGISVLVAHNIDIAPRVPGITPGAAVKIHGEYVWTDKGGTVHWTHKDRNGKHEDGWIEFRGQRYQ